MRKCVWFPVALFAFVSFALPNQASAQGIFLGAGATFPTGDYGEYADAGWMVEGGIGFPLGENGLQVFADGLYGSNKHDFEGDKTNLLGGFGGLEYVAESGIFFFGEVGFLNHDFKSEDYPEDEGSDTGFAFGGGAGYSFPIGGLSGWVLGRYIQGQFDEENTALFGLMAGISIPLAGGEG